MGLLVPLQPLLLQLFAWHGHIFLILGYVQWGSSIVLAAYAMVMIVLAIGFYIGLNFMSTPPPTSLDTVFDDFSREASSFMSHMKGDDQRIEPISDVGINKINVLMFDDSK